MSLLCQATERSFSDLVHVSVGPMVLSYFVFLDEYHVKPRDLEELVDGLLYIDLKQIRFDRLKKSAEAQSGT